MTLDDLQKAHRELIYNFITGKINLEHWKLKHDELFSAFKIEYDTQMHAPRKQLEEFEKSKVKTVEWLRKYTMISDDIVLSMCQAALRVFIDKELLEAKKETASK